MTKSQNNHDTLFQGLTQTDESAVYALIYKSVAKYLGEESEHPQKLTMSCGQNIDNNYMSIAIKDIEKEEALEIANSKHFEDAFLRADNRRKLKSAFKQAREFFAENVIDRNPFPPKEKFVTDLKELKKKYKPNKGAYSSVIPSESTYTTTSCVSILTTSSTFLHSNIPTENVLKTPTTKSLSFSSLGSSYGPSSTYVATSSYSSTSTSQSHGKIRRCSKLNRKVHRKNPNLRRNRQQ